MDAPRTFRDHYDARAKVVRRLLEAVLPAEQVDGAMRDARDAFVRMEHEIPYADRPDHTMYDAAFEVFQMLAAFDAAASRGVDAHAFGRALLALPAPDGVRPMPRVPSDGFLADAEESRRAAAPNEFVFEIVEGDDETDWGMNVTSCAVCHAYARHGAMDLVPYLCATDDVVSDAAGHGLRRTGTIALGAHRCDFRFRRDGAPRPLAPQYPDAIRVRPRGDR